MSPNDLESGHFKNTGTVTAENRTTLRNCCCQERLLRIEILYFLY